MTATVYGAADKVSKTGDTMTGTLILDGATPLKIPGGAGAGKILTSDASGNGSWSGWTGTGLAPSGDTTGAADNAAVQALLNLGANVVSLQAGAFYLTGVVGMSPPQYIVGAGEELTVIHAVNTSTADCIRLYNPTDPGGTFANITAWGGGVMNLSIDGTGAAAGSWGLHIGDGEEYRIWNVTIRNFTGAGSGGCWIDNSIWYTEKLRARFAVRNNTTNLLLDVSSVTADVSMGYCDIDVDVYAETNQAGVVLQNGALFYNGRLAVHGNFKTPTSGGNTSACLTLTGSGGKEGSYSCIRSCGLEVQVETSNSTGTTAQTISFGSASNTIVSCHGFLRFHNTWTQSNISTWVGSGAGLVTTPQGMLTFFGEVDGDTTLAPAGTSGANPSPLTVLGALLYTGNAAQPGGGVSLDKGDVWTLTLSQNATFPLMNTDTYTAPQRKLFIITQAASGGPWTVSWAASGGTIYWAGGAAPAMPATAGAVMVVEFVTPDGSNWYGNVKTLNQDASLMQPDGVAAAGSGGIAAQADHVHPQTAYADILTAPAGTTVETFPRIFTNGTTGALTSGTLYVVLVPIPAGLVVNGCEFVVKGTAASGVTHGWYVLLDHNLNVQAVTADQTGGSEWTSTGTPYALDFTASHTVTNAAAHYLGVCIVATTMPVLAAIGSSLPSGLVSESPVLCGNAGTGYTTPPATGTQLNSGAVTAQVTVPMYARTF